MSHIDDGLFLLDEDRERIEANGLHLRNNGNDNYVLIDPTVQKADPKKGRYQGKFVKLLIAQAMKDRQEIAKNKNVIQFKASQELSDVELDNSGQRQKTVKAPAQRQKKEGRYIRVARFLIENPNATDLEIMNAARVGDATLSYCLDAFAEITAAYREAGMLVSKAALAAVEATLEPMQESEPIEAAQPEPEAEKVVSLKPKGSKAKRASKTKPVEALIWDIIDLENQSFEILEMATGWYNECDKEVDEDENFIDLSHTLPEGLRLVEVELATA
jgi:hypothetical protein